MEILKKGSKGDQVKLLQQCLNLEQDGIFGSVTEEAVKKFQSEHSLAPDGIVGVATWNVLTPKNTKRKINDIILHCSATPEGTDYTVETIRKWHKAKGWSDIGYHYVIYRDGTVHNGRNVAIVGAHCEGHNTGSIGICYIGGVAKDSKTPKDTRTKEQKKGLCELVKRLLSEYNLTLNNVHCHNSYTNKKACPSFSLDTFKKEYQDYVK